MPSTTTSFALAPEARQAVNQELNFFEGLLEPSQQAATRQLLQLLASSPSEMRYTTMAQPTLATMGLAPAALRRAGQDAGLITGVGQNSSQTGIPQIAGPQRLGDVSQAIQYLNTTNPNILHMIRQAAMKQFATNPSLVDPRYASFFKPVTTSETNLSDWEKAMQALNLFLGASGAVAGFL